MHNYNCYLIIKNDKRNSYIIILSIIHTSLIRYNGAVYVSDFIIMIGWNASHLHANY